MDGAIKCRHCQSLLVPIALSEPASSPADDQQITYILDRGLIRFGKFVAAALAIFFLFGVYAFGVDLKGLLSEMRQAEDKIRSSEDKIRATEDRLRLSEDKVSRLIKDVEESKKEVERGKSEINTLLSEYRKVTTDLRQAKDVAEKSSKEAEQARIAIKNLVAQVKLDSDEASSQIFRHTTKILTENQEITLTEIKQESPQKFRRGDDKGELLKSKLWPVGSELKVRFIDGSSSLHEKVVVAANEWTKYANIHFKFYSTSNDAEVRISFNEQGSWAHIGTDALAVPKDQPTVNFGFLNSSTEPDVFTETVLHEFGHVLGLYHEHLNPNRTIEFDMEALYKDLSGPPNFWSKELIDTTFKKIDGLIGYRKFDPQSVMMYPMQDRWLTNGSVPNKTTKGLSEEDRHFIADLYPRA
ncbi:hypothetical protein GGE65_008104 [Skermanella aerolata]|uniref:M12 family metallopeptidase n=1 Tax=Skermanella aerolata TaxID=393310 RepID=UPI003D24E3FA